MSVISECQCRSRPAIRILAKHLGHLSANIDETADENRAQSGTDVPAWENSGLDSINRSLASLVADVQPVLRQILTYAQRRI